MCKEAEVGAQWEYCKKLTLRCRIQGAQVRRQVPPVVVAGRPHITITALIGCMRSVLKTPQKLEASTTRTQTVLLSKMHCVAHFAEETCAERPANGDLETPSQDLEKGKTKTPFYEQTFLWRTEKSSFCFTLFQNSRFCPKKKHF